MSDHPSCSVIRPTVSTTFFVPTPTPVLCTVSSPNSLFLAPGVRRMVGYESKVVHIGREWF